MRPVDSTPPESTRSPSASKTRMAPLVGVDVLGEGQRHPLGRPRQHRAGRRIRLGELRVRACRCGAEQQQHESGGQHRGGAPNQHVPSIVAAAMAAVVGRAPRIAGALLLAALGMVMAADPAGAHGVGGIRPTNYETVITGTRPQVQGIAVQPVDLGDRLELTNETARDVVLLGYDGEPYLRVGPRGVFENTRSPATYVNRTRRGTTPVPSSADPEAPPEWRQVSDEAVVAMARPPLRTGPRGVIRRPCAPIRTTPTWCSASGSRCRTAAA